MGRRPREGSMGQRALFIVLVLVVVVGLFAYFGYNSYDAKRAGLNGDVFSTEPSGGKTKLGYRFVGGEHIERTIGRISGPRRSGDPDGPGHSGDGAERGGDDARRDRFGRYDQRESTERDSVCGEGQISALSAGRLTWRLNTETGQTCIIFATDDEWRKPRVYRAGCGVRSGR